MIIKDLGMVIEPSGKKQHRVVVKCEKCEKEIETRISRVKDNGNLCKSCMLKLRNTTHGLYSHPLKGVHNTMKQRCTNPNAISYPNYGARGIKVCGDWQSFKPFYDWSMKNGYKKGLTIDRIDNNGNYEPSNCQWITLEENISKEAILKKEDIIDICEMYKNNYVTQRKIASIYGVNNSRIGQILKENNIDTEYRGGSKKVISKKDSDTILKDKRVASEIAKDYNVHKNTIYRIKQGKYYV